MAAKTKDFKKLPTKIHEKDATMIKQADGMFFEKMARPQEGNFFRDMRGRDDASFHQKTAQGTGASGAQAAVNTAQSNIAGPAPQAAQSPGASSGNFGSGEGLGEKKKKSESERLALLLSSASGKDGEKESKDKDEKTASAAPSDWDGADLATGFHRATKEQPEALEPGGERFHSSVGNGSQYRGEGSRTHGLVEGGSMRKRQGTGHQMGKHASAAPPRFMGTSFNKTAMKITEKSTWDKSLGQAKDTAQKTLSQAGETAGKALDAGSKSPLAVGIAALLAAKLGMRGLKGVGRLAGVKRKAPASLIGRGVGAIKKVINS
jgi:hypothetical protein